MSTILNIDRPLDNPAILHDLGYERCDWGSPRQWDPNHEMYETFVKNGMWQVMYFPPRFEGYVNLGSIDRRDVRGRAVMSHIRSPHSTHSYYLSPVLETELDLQTFIHSVLSKQYPSLYQHERTFK